MIEVASIDELSTALSHVSTMQVCRFKRMLAKLGYDTLEAFKGGARVDVELYINRSGSRNFGYGIIHIASPSRQKVLLGVYGMATRLYQVTDYTGKKEVQDIRIQQMKRGYEQFALPRTFIVAANSDSAPVGEGLPPTEPLCLSVKVSVSKVMV